MDLFLGQHIRRTKIDKITPRSGRVQKRQRIKTRDIISFNKAKNSKGRMITKV